MVKNMIKRMVKSLVAKSKKQFRKEIKQEKKKVKAVLKKDMSKLKKDLSKIKDKAKSKFKKESEKKKVAKRLLMALLLAGTINATNVPNIKIAKSSFKLIAGALTIYTSSKFTSILFINKENDRKDIFDTVVIEGVDKYRFVKNGQEKVIYDKFSREEDICGKRKNIGGLTITLQRRAYLNNLAIPKNRMKEFKEDYTFYIQSGHEVFLTKDNLMFYRKMFREKKLTKKQEREVIKQAMSKFNLFWYELEETKKYQKIVEVE